MNNCTARTASALSPDKLILEASAELLYRAVENIMRNALRYSSHGGTIELALRSRAGTGRVEVTVSDHGPGVAEEQLEHIFEPFVRVSAERRRDKEKDNELQHPKSDLCRGNGAQHSRSLDLLVHRW